MIERICWNITSKCNENCGFCFRDNSRLDLSLDENLIIANKLIQSDIKHISFSGGEALLYAGIYQIIPVFYRSNISTTMISNCKELNEEIMQNVSHYLDWISIPIDSIRYIPGMRDNGHIKNVERVLNSVKTGMGIQIKINTVVSKQNVFDLPQILEFITKYKCVSRWNIFEFTPLRGKANLNRDYYSISSDDDQFVCKFLSEIAYLEDKISIKYKRKKTIENSYFVISPNGDITYNSSDGTEIIWGNLLYDSIESIEKKISLDESLYKIRTSNKDLIII